MFFIVTMSLVKASRRSAGVRSGRRNAIGSLVSSIVTVVVKIAKRSSPVQRISRLSMQLVVT